MDCEEKKNINVQFGPFYDFPLEIFFLLMLFFLQIYKHLDGVELFLILIEWWSKMLCNVTYTLYV